MMKKVGNAIIIVDCECDCGHKTTIAYSDKEWTDNIYLTIHTNIDNYEKRDLFINTVCQNCGNKETISLDVIINEYYC